MADIPLTVWPDEFAYVQQDLTRLYEHHPRYESSWFGSLVSTFAIVCSPSSSRRFSIRPQFILRQPVGGVLANEHTPGPDLADPDPDDDSDSDDGLAEVSFVSHDFQVQGRGQGREHVIRIPDFVIDHVQNGRRHFMLLVEVKASTNVGSKDFMRFTRYLRRLEEIGAAGGAVHDVEAYRDQKRDGLNLMLRLVAGLDPGVSDVETCSRARLSAKLGIVLAKSVTYCVLEIRNLMYSAGFNPSLGYP
ncbi:hypothetical protein BDV93DRAFT_592640 [Ceratobasidium sp. AG-I]|nr:hypothetical protein BDV93DRAFT_592640 [Ceratobasidium sp. AG-I]